VNARSRCYGVASSPTGDLRPEHTLPLLVGEPAMDRAVRGCEAVAPLRFAVDDRVEVAALDPIKSPG